MIAIAVANTTPRVSAPVRSGTAAPSGRASLWSALLKDAEVIAVITEGSKRAKNIAEQTMERVRQAVGLR